MGKDSKLKGKLQTLLLILRNMLVLAQLLRIIKDLVA